MVNGRSLQLVEMGVKGGVKQVGTDLVNFFKISPQVDLCFLEGEKMTSVRDSMVFLDHAKFSAPLSLPTSSAPEKPSVDVEAREFKQFPRLKKGKVTLINYKIILCFKKCEELLYLRYWEWIFLLHNNKNMTYFVAVECIQYITNTLSYSLCHHPIQRFV